MDPAQVHIRGHLTKQRGRWCLHVTDVKDSRDPPLLYDDLKSVLGGRLSVSLQEEPPNSSEWFQQIKGSIVSPLSEINESYSTNVINLREEGASLLTFEILFDVSADREVDRLLEDPSVTVTELGDLRPVDR